VNMGANELNITGTVLSIHGSPFQLPASLEGKAVLMSSGELYVADSYKRDPHVASYRALASKTRNAPADIQLVATSLDIIAKLTSLGAKSTAATGLRSARQNEVLDRMKDATKERASDVHYVNGEKYTTVKYRIDGILHTVDEIMVSDGAQQSATMYETMTDVSQATWKDFQSQDGRIAGHWLSELGLTGSRIATRPLETGNLLVLRLLYPGSVAGRTLEQLGYDDPQCSDINRMIRRDGVNMFSGTTGSGKSTSLQIICQMILDLYGNKIHLLTIEDPPEYIIKGAIQTPLKYDATKPEEIGLAWARAISNAMRLDPDFLMVGELRDYASAMAAIQAAMTGHGLWTTTHAKHTFASLDRLADMNVPIGRLTDASLVTGLINQSLVPRLCTYPGCARPFAKYRDEVGPEVRARIEEFCDVGKVRIRCAPTPEGTQCPKCGGLGYFERTVAAEVVVPNQALMDRYRIDGSHAARSHWVNALGGMTSMAHMISKANAGTVDPVAGEEAMRRMLDEDKLTIA
jgi:general secretion pathway protein E